MLVAHIVSLVILSWKHSMNLQYNAILVFFACFPSSCKSKFSVDRLAHLSTPKLSQIGSFTYCIVPHQSHTNPPLMSTVVTAPFNVTSIALTFINVVFYVVLFKLSFDSFSFLVITSDAKFFSWRVYTATIWTIITTSMIVQCHHWSFVTFVITTRWLKWLDWKPTKIIYKCNNTYKE